MLFFQKQIQHNRHDRSTGGELDSLLTRVLYCENVYKLPDLIPMVLKNL